MRLLALYIFTIAISACLLFAVQPLVGRLVLPLYGGSPAVWNSCMMFFQAILLLGYLYAHLSSRWLPIRGQMALHIAVVIGAGLLLPIGVPAGWTISDPENPSWSLLGLLALAVGGPFFALSANATLLQRWFSSTTHRSAADPYFLYAVSNAGSMVGLLSYPFFVEPNFGLTQQTGGWAIGFAVLVFGVIACAAEAMAGGVANSPASILPSTDPSVANSESSPNLIRNSQRATWVLLAFVPSSWLLSVTTRLTTDIAPIPLLWVVPLALYLLTFVLVFASKPILPHRWIQHWMAAVAIVLVAATVASNSHGLAALHLFAFFVGAMLCHGELVLRRPDASGLTEFYLWLSVGGVLGGVFNAIVAPMAFTVLLEFGIVVGIACLFTLSFTPDDSDEGSRESLRAASDPNPSGKRGKRRRSLESKPIDTSPPKVGEASFLSLETLKSNWPLAVAALLSVMLLRGVSSDNANSSAWATLLVVVTIPALLCLAVTRWSFAFAGLVAATLMISEFDAGPQYDVVYRARSFFGRHLVVDDKASVGMGSQPHFRRLLHGTTQHGFQNLDPAYACEPLAYYHRSGPLGDVFAQYEEKSESRGPVQVAAIGLGTGAVACYANDYREITFFEVDPVVRQIAQDDGYFTYLSRCGGGSCRVVMGDGRQTLQASKNDHYAIILLDAFSSDAVPTHLLTQEAIEMYMTKLRPGGVLAFHISNQYLELDRVLSITAQQLGLACRVKKDLFASKSEREMAIRSGKADSSYFVCSAEEETLARLDESWRKPAIDSSIRVWTDDYSNILSVMRLGR